MISEPALHQFSTSLRGQMLLPGHPGYEDARKIHWRTSTTRQISSAWAKISGQQPQPEPTQLDFNPRPWRHRPRHPTARSCLTAR